MIIKRQLSENTQKPAVFVKGYAASQSRMLCIITFSIGWDL